MFWCIFSIVIIMFIRILKTKQTNRLTQTDEHTQCNEKMILTFLLHVKYIIIRDKMNE